MSGSLTTEGTQLLSSLAMTNVSVKCTEVKGHLMCDMYTDKMKYLNAVLMNHLSSVNSQNGLDSHGKFKSFILLLHHNRSCLLITS